MHTAGVTAVCTAGPVVCCLLFSLRVLQWRHKSTTYANKRLSCRRGTARRRISAETLSTAAQLYDKKCFGVSGTPSDSHVLFGCLRRYDSAVFAIIARPSVRSSVCPSVTSRSCTKTAKRRTTQTILHDSPGTLAS